MKRQLSGQWLRLSENTGASESPMAGLEPVPSGMQMWILFPRAHKLLRQLGSLM